MANPQVVTPPTEPNAKFLSLQEMSPEQLSSFERDGKMIERPATADTPAPAEPSAAQPDSAPGQPAEQVASTDALSSAASEPAKPEKKPKRGIDARIDQLSAQNATLESELRRRRELRAALDAEPEPTPKAKPAATSADSAPAASAEHLKQEIARIKALPGAPKIGDFEDPDDWGIALSAFVSRNLTEQMLSQHDAQSAYQAEVSARHRTIGSKLEEQYQAHPDLAEQVDQRFLDIVPLRDLPKGVTAGPHHFIKDQILYECENTVALGAFYSTPEGLAEMRAMFQMAPPQIIRTLALRDHALGADSQAAVVEAGDEPTSPHISKAPPPPPVAGRKTAAPSDPLMAAIKANDFNAFNEQENARLLAKKGKARKSA